LKKIILLMNSKGEKLFIDASRLRLKNLRKRIFAWAGVIENLRMAKGVRMAMYTCTYDVEGTLGKACQWQVGDIREFMRRLRARMGKRLLAYAWVAEMQKRGVIHYHVVIVFNGRAPVPDQSYISKDGRGHERHFEKLWDKGISHSEFKMRSPYYLAEYVGKEYQKEFDNFPIGAHAWAVWISDLSLKQNLRTESLNELRRSLFAEALENTGGVGWVEAWEEMEDLDRLRKAVEKEAGVGWRYVRQMMDEEEGEEFRDLVSKHIFTKVAPAVVAGE